MLEKYLKINEEVKKALDENRPVVALESTIISHGMPYPQNMETALECEKIIRDHGAIPATIAIIKGKLCVGLSKDEIEYIAKEGTKVVKTSRRDIPVIVAEGLDGATTVAATMFISLIWWAFPVTEIISCFAGYLFLKKIRKNRVDVLN